jgi:hypothetical protein
MNNQPNPFSVVNVKLRRSACDFTMGTSIQMGRVCPNGVSKKIVGRVIGYMNLGPKCAVWSGGSSFNGALSEPYW